MTLNTRLVSTPVLTRTRSPSWPLEQFRDLDVPRESSRQTSTSRTPGALFENPQ